MLDTSHYSEVSLFDKNTLSVILVKYAIMTKHRIKINRLIRLTTIKLVQHNHLELVNIPNCNENDIWKFHIPLKSIQ